MLRKLVSALLCLAFAWPQSIVADTHVAAPTSGALAAPDAGDTALTIYNHDFAVVRQALSLDLKAGVNEIHFGDATLRLEPDSVVLRDLTGHRSLQILEQNYRNDPVSQDLMLSLFEGKTLEFVRWNKDQQKEIVQGRVVRSGFVPHGGSQQPIIEVDGRLQFFLPGQPVFPALASDTILKPTLNWLLQTDRTGPGNAEVAYITGGMSWNAAYNIVAPEKGDVIDLVGWITMNNQTGKTFDNARIKLLAGDVNKVQPQNVGRARDFAMKTALAEAAAPPVSEKAFDEYHLYTLARPTTLHDQETKQVEFVRGTGVKSQRIYVYEGFDTSRYGWYGSLNQDPNYGTQSNSKIWVMQEFKNSKENGLGMALPAGRVRFYRRDTDGQLQFTGENVIDHTPSDETLRLYTGNTFDVVGERKRAEFHSDTRGHWFDETFEIKVRNHKKEPVTVRVVERLYRWTNWQITSATHKWDKKDAQTIEFPVTVAPDGEGVVTYTVHYSW